MVTLLLKTKLYIPPVRSELVPRPRLTERLNAGRTHKLTLISAPAGFGKTTLLSEWVHQADVAAAWLSLDEADNDPIRFWSYVIAALQTVQVDIGETALAALQAPQPQPLSIEALLTSLINEIIAADPITLVLILDDLHVITTPQINKGITFLLDHLPQRMHLILSTRADPPWPLARLRARQEMVELRTEDLRFTLDEATAFLNAVMKLGLSAEDIAALDARTEGWIAGLQMAALSMKGRDTRAFIQAFSGSHRFVMDYLVEEVLDRQPSDVREFLLKTSVLDRLTASLCDAVMSKESFDSQDVLTHLERANLFLIPLDDERRWYRYHHLFADLLTNRLSQRHPDQSSILHCRASVWYEARGLIADAVGHALVAQDIEQIERLVARNALAVIYHGGLTTVTGWLNELSEETVRSRPWLCIAHAWALAYSGQHEAIEPLLEHVEQALHHLDERKPDEVQRLQGHTAAVRAYVVCFEQEMPRAIELVREALDHLSEGDSMERGFCALLLGKLLRFNGDLAEAPQALGEAIAISREIQDSHLAVDALYELAALQFLQGQLREAATTCRDALRLADQSARQGGQRPLAAGGVCAFLSAVLYEWNELDAAKSTALEGLELGQRWGQADSLTDCYFDLATALQAAGDADLALETIQNAKPIARRLSQWSIDWIEACEARIRLAQGDVSGATRWAETSGMRADNEFSFHHSFIHLTVARVLFAQGELDECLRLLAMAVDRTEQAGAWRYVIRALVLRAVVYRAKGEIDQAQSSLARALTLAEPQGYVRVFIDEGAPMGELLEGALARGVAMDYVSRLLAELRKESTVMPSAEKRPLQPLIEPLSDRELEVLRLLLTDLSSTEIAQELYISKNTVRSHIGHIYDKLGVHSRADAVQRAQELGLL